MMAAVGLTKVSQKNTNFEHNEVLVFLLFTLHNSKHVIIFRVNPFFQANEQTVNARSQFCLRLFCTTSSVLILFRQALGNQATDENHLLVIWKATIDISTTKSITVTAENWAATLRITKRDAEVHISLIQRKRLEFQMLVRQVTEQQNKCTAVTHSVHELQTDWPFVHDQIFFGHGLWWFSHGTTRRHSDHPAHGKPSVHQTDQMQFLKFFCSLLKPFEVNRVLNIHRNHKAY